MGDRSQARFLSQSLLKLQQTTGQSLSGKALITGAALEGHSLDIATLITGLGYQVTTSDITPGEGVDLTWDLQQPPPDELHNEFSLVVSCSVLEHIPDAKSAATHLTMSLKPGGLIYISLPWVWRYHRYPDDYHRFHASSVDKLFDGTKALARAWSTSPDCKLYTYKPELDQELSRVINGVKYLPYMMLHEIRRRV